MNETLKQVYDFADNAHGAQTRKYTPDRYMVHPKSVMDICSKYSTDVSMLAAALLHDVLEDTETSKEQLKDFLDGLFAAGTSVKTFMLVEELTDVYVKEDFPQWNRKKRKARERERLKKTSAAAQTIKYADIIDNCKEIVSHDPDFAPVFLKECKSLLTILNEGDKNLHNEAVSTVSKCLDALQSIQ